MLMVIQNFKEAQLKVSVIICKHHLNGW